MCIPMSEQQVPQIKKNRRYLHEKKHCAEHDHKIHEIERLIEGQDGDDVMSVCLII